ncbi:MAG: hypothetical protein KKC37_11470, partial [Proteobacteria bacterium]|nr:hypothetical protein [Pseudomonadota bacterium]
MTKSTAVKVLAGVTLFAATVAFWPTTAAAQHAGPRFVGPRAHGAWGARPPGAARWAYRHPGAARWAYRHPGA